MPNFILYESHKSLLHAATEFLVRNFSSHRLHSSDILLLVPTAGAASALHSTLSGHANSQGKHPTVRPTIKTPLQIFTDVFPPNIATRSECLHAWARSIQSFKPFQIDRILPTQKIELTTGRTINNRSTIVSEFSSPDELLPNPSDLLNLATALLELNQILGEDGLQIGAPELAQASGEDPIRWQQLTAIYKRYLHHLHEAGLEDPCIQMRKIAHDRILQLPWRHILLVGVYELPQLLIRYLRQLEDAGTQIHTLCPEPLAQEITPFAQPIPQKENVIPLHEDSITVTASPADTGQKIVKLLANNPLSQPALFACDPDLIDPIKRQFQNSKMRLYDPSGIPLRCIGLGKLLSDWMQFVESPNQHSLYSLSEHPPLDKDVPSEARLSDQEISMDASKLTAWIQERVAADASHPNEVTTAVLEILEETKNNRLPNISPKQKWQLIRFRLQKTQVYTKHTAEPHELRGWLEVPFHRSNSCILAGLHEGCVPEPLPNNPFLSPALRSTYLSLNNESRFARDAFILKMLCLRHQTDALHIIINKTSKDDQPILPSRLLLTTADNQLPQRVLHLFKNQPEQTPRAAAQPCWRLQLPQIPPPTTISATQFKTYLDCPLRFYLRHQLNMEESPLIQHEMDALQFGDLTHIVLEDFGCNEALRNSTNPNEIHAYLTKRLDYHFAKRYGTEPSLPFLLQKQAIATRLEWFTQVHINECQAGWKIIDAEFTTLIPLQIGGLTLKARIDRLDYHPNTKRYRVMDYKTFERTDQSAEKCHLVRNGKPDGSGKAIKWLDLQLPLYKWIAQHRLGKEVPIETAYFHISPGQSDVRIDGFDIDEPTLDSALECATTIAQHVVQGHFWPPNPTPTYDNFQRLFSGYSPEEVLSKETIEFLHGNTLIESNDTHRPTDRNT